MKVNIAQSLSLVALLVSQTAMATEIVNSEYITSQAGTHNTNPAPSKIVSVEGLDVHLTQAESVMAKSFHLSDDEYARYKYLLENTPRKFWTPNISPVTLLGIEAKTDTERTRYAELAYKLKTEREAKEKAFASIAVEVEYRLDPKSQNRTPITEQKFGFAESLPDNKTSLTSVFINANACMASAECQQVIGDLVKSNSSTNLLNIYFVQSTKAQISDFAVRNNISSEKVKSGSINLAIESGQISAAGLGKYKLPFFVTQSNHGNAIKEFF